MSVGVRPWEGRRSANEVGGKKSSGVHLYKENNDTSTRQVSRDCVVNWTEIHTLKVIWCAFLQACAAFYERTVNVLYIGLLTLVLDITCRRLPETVRIIICEQRIICSQNPPTNTYSILHAFPCACSTSMFLFCCFREVAQRCSLRMHVTCFSWSTPRTLAI